MSTFLSPIFFIICLEMACFDDTLWGYFPGWIFPDPKNEKLLATPWWRLDTNSLCSCDLPDFKVFRSEKNTNLDDFCRYFVEGQNIAKFAKRLGLSEDRFICTNSTLARICRQLLAVSSVANLVFTVLLPMQRIAGFPFRLNSNTHLFRNAHFRDPDELFSYSTGNTSH